MVLHISFHPRTLSRFVPLKGHYLRLARRRIRVCGRFVPLKGHYLRLARRRIRICGRFVPLKDITSVLRDGGSASWLTRCITQPCMQGGDFATCFARGIDSDLLARKRTRILGNQMHNSTLHARRRFRNLLCKGHRLRLACKEEDSHSGLPDALPPIHHSPYNKEKGVAPSFEHLVYTLAPRREDPILTLTLLKTIS